MGQQKYGVEMKEDILGKKRNKESKDTSVSGT